MLNKIGKDYSRLEEATRSDLQKKMSGESADSALQIIKNQSLGMNPNRVDSVPTPQSTPDEGTPEFEGFQGDSSPTPLVRYSELGIAGSHRSILDTKSNLASVDFWD